MKIMLTFLLFLSVSVNAQQDYKILYERYFTTTSEGVPIQYARKEDTSRLKNSNMCLTFIFTDSLTYSFYEFKGRCGTQYPDSALTFGLKAKHHDVFYNQLLNVGYHYTAYKKKKRYILFKPDINRFITTETNINISGIKCKKGFIVNEKDTAYAIVTDDPGYPGKVNFLNNNFPGLVIEYFKPSNDYYISMKIIERGNYKILMPVAKLLENKIPLIINSSPNNSK